MECPSCSSSKTCSLERPTTLGYRRFRCRSCGRQFNERTGTAFNYLEFPTDVVLLVVRWRLRYKLSLRDLAEMFLERGFEFTHEAVREWEARFACRCSLTSCGANDAALRPNRMLSVTECNAAAISAGLIRTPAVKASK